MKNYNVNNGDLILVNSDYKFVTKNFEMNLVKFDNLEIYLDSRAMSALLQIFKKLNITDEILPVSGYRHSLLQKDIYENSLVDNGEVFTKKYVALPGHSEHETGLAIDLGLNEGKIDYIRPDFPYYGICQDFRNLAPDYGFIERYPKDKTEITKIAHEPWHFRYVGFPHSSIMTKFNLCLEEYIQALNSFDMENPFLFENYLIWFGKIPDNSAHMISGNNIDGFIMTNKIYSS